MFIVLFYGVYAHFSYLIFETKPLVVGRALTGVSLLIMGVLSAVRETAKHFIGCLDFAFKIGEYSR